MAGRFEGLTDVEREVFRNIFLSERQSGRAWPPCRFVTQNFEFAAVAADHRLPVVRPSAKAAMGIKKLKPPAAQVMAS
ncbi:MAG: hypothetical protein ACTFAK_00200 [Candidatus Electronema sp. VV]